MTTTWGSAFVHPRAYGPALHGRMRRCPWCPGDSGRMCTHAGSANGVVLVLGCSWHVRQWVRDPAALVVRRP